MSELDFISVKLNNIIDFSIGTNNSKFTKTFINKNKGDIPVYGASKNEEDVSYGYVKDNIDGIKYFEDCLTCNIDGSSGVVFYRKGKFSLSEKVIPLKILDEIKSNISNKYIKYMITIETMKQNYDYSNKAYKKKLQELSVIIPISEDGTYDLEEQEYIANQYEDLENKKTELLLKKEILNQTSMIIKNIDYRKKEVILTDLFRPERGKGDYTKTYCNNNQGDYPVYSGSTVAEFAHINKFDYDGEYLSWAIDGLAGYMMYLDGKFSATNHRGILVPLRKDLDLNFIRFILEPIFREKSKGRRGANGENEYTALPPKMIKDILIPMPIKEDGTYDVEKQKEIANKYIQVEQVKKNICSKIDEITQISPIINLDKVASLST